MSLLNNGDIIAEVLVRNNRTTTDSFITDTNLFDWLRQAHTWASSFKKWPFTEGRVSTTWTGTEEISFEGYKADTIRFIQIGGKRLQKINFEDYQLMRENYPDANDRVYSDFSRILFINPSADVSGTLTAYGQFQPTLDPTDLAQETVFSSWDAEGNEAIVEKMTAYLKAREHLPDETKFHDDRAMQKLEEVAGRIGQEQFAYHSKNDDGMFKRMDVVNGGFEDEVFRRDQFS